MNHYSNEESHPDSFTEFLIQKVYCIYLQILGERTETEAISLDVLVSGSMSPDTFVNNTYNEFRNDWGGIAFDHCTLKKRLDRKLEFEAGDMGALVDTSKWETSGNAWDDNAIALFRKFYQLPSPAVYLDNTGRKVHYTNFDGEKEYNFLYGLNPKSIYFHIYHFPDCNLFICFEERWMSKSFSRTHLALVMFASKNMGAIRVHDVSRRSRWYHIIFDVIYV